MARRHFDGTCACGMTMLFLSALFLVWVIGTIVGALHGR